MDATVGSVVESLQKGISSRHKAVDILRKVAEAGSYGSFPSDVTCEQLGAALERICLNAHQEDPMFKVFSGWRQAELERDRSLQKVLRD